jgi:hypothetical protein
MTVDEKLDLLARFDGRQPARCAEGESEVGKCSAFQYPVADSKKRCNVCGAITTFYGTHDMPNNDLTPARPR